MEKRRKKLSTRLKIVGATLTSIFSLFSVFSATYAWFATNNTVAASGMSISVQSPDNVEFDLYYLDSFTISQGISKDGNYNSGIGVYAGYETSTNNPLFKKIYFSNDGNVINDADHGSDPTNISHLWPAHKLTYAIVLTHGRLNSFSLKSWAETTLPTVLTQVDDEDVEISLSWAINIYGGGYYISNTGNIVNDLASGFEQYDEDIEDETLVDTFGYSESNPALDPKPAVTVVDSNTIFGTEGTNKHTILYFSIEFSNDSDTFYYLDGDYYIKDEDGTHNGNSNCYENLTLSNLVFELC